MPAIDFCFVSTLENLMPRLLLNSALLLMAVSLFALTGCGSDPRGLEVSGTVTYKGTPVPAGDIQFVPEAGNTGPPGRAVIVNGKYNTSDTGGQGTVGGPHQVIINGFDGIAKPDEELPHGKPLFPEFKSTFDIPKDGDSTKDFDITK